MHQTDKYKFSIIDPSDNFSPDALNDNANKLEASLITHEAALAQHKSETTAALAANKAEAEAALAAQKKEWQAADTTLSQTIAAVEKGASLVHLGGPLTGAGTIDLSGVDMSKYRALLAFAYVLNASTVSIKNLSLQTSGGGATLIWIYNTLKDIAIHCTSTYTSGTVRYNTTGLTWENLDRLECTNTVTFIDLYGVKV